MKVYGPYTRSDGRQHVIIVDDAGVRRTKSYPRYLVELALGRELYDDETVDHLDGDVGNNSLDNFEVISRSENARRSRQRIERVTLICPTCNMLHRKRHTVWFVQKFVQFVNAEVCERCKNDKCKTA